MKKRVFFLFIFAASLIIPAVSTIPMASAQETGPLNYQLLEAVPGSDSNGKMSDYLQALYKFALWAVGIAALFMLSVGGMMYLTSAGNTSQISNAKKVIFDSLIGLTLAVISWLILYTINPQLTEANLDIFNTLGISAIRGTTDIPPEGTGTTSPAIATPGQGTDCSSDPKSCKCSASTISQKTKEVLACMDAKKNLTLGQVTTNGGKHTCKITATSASISCHFGGTKCNGVGNAIDYGGPSGPGGGQKYQDIIDAAKACGAYGAYCEDGNGKRMACSSTAVNHIHITVESGCGCN